MPKWRGEPFMTVAMCGVQCLWSTTVSGPLIHNHTTIKCYIAVSNITTSCNMPPCILFAIHLFLICMNRIRLYNMPNFCSNPNRFIWRFDTCKKKSKIFAQGCTTKYFGPWNRLGLGGGLCCLSASSFLYVFHFTTSQISQSRPYRVSENWCSVQLVGDPLWKLYWLVDIRWCGR